MKIITILMLTVVCTAIFLAGASHPGYAFSPDLKMTGVAIGLFVVGIFILTRKKS